MFRLDSAGFFGNRHNTNDLRLSALGRNNYQGDTLVLDGTLRLDCYEILGFIRVGAVAVPGPLSIGTGTGASAFVVLERNHQIAASATGLVEFLDARSVHQTPVASTVWSHRRNATKVQLPDECHEPTKRLAEAKKTSLADTCDLGTRTTADGRRSRG